VRRFFLLSGVFAAALFAQISVAPDTPRVIEAFRRIASPDLWPGFTPASTPVEFFDGTATVLLNHPSPPAGFQPAAGFAVYPGRHDSVHANTGSKLNGIPTATADLSSGKSGPDASAALLVHEAFHVFEAARYPKWPANETDLFVYPADSAPLLALRRLETAALVRALAATDPKEAVCQAGAALTMRARRFGSMPPNAAAYERGSELNEGLAQYVEYRSIGKPAALTAEDFPAGHAQARQRAYATGQALALLLDRFDPAWKSHLSADPVVPLDELLRKSLGDGASCNITNEETQAAQARARQDVAVFLADIDRRKQEYLGTPGERLELTAGKEPLSPLAFDPWNVVILDAGLVLHTRWLKLGNRSGSMEILGRSAMTAPAGEHPLFTGVRAMILTGLTDLKVSQANGKVTVEAQGVKGTFVGTLVNSGGVFRLRLP